ncbi:uncharacterized protein LOC112126780 [Cimex lectularius]|uniref:Uncharacterized protein n=1 Tax=Cimex lectularius TaxID=79782 RepID=A0A8I6SI52_CIMLE|nr:uncharacterized protein LOC112126780 [Cimex lectularius]
MGEKGNKAPFLADFFTLQQKEDAFIEIWKRITKEDIDFEALSKEEEITYYNNPNKTALRQEYDIRFHFDLDFDPRTKRCDRHNLNIVRNNIYKEEMNRIFPVVVSHTYGHRKTNLEGTALISHKKKRIIQDLSSRNQLNLKPTKKNPPIQGYPQLS